MELPAKIRHLIEALRGGGASTFQGGQLVDQQYGPAANAVPARGTQQGMPTGMDGFRLARQEAAAMGQQPPTYAEWVASQQVK